MKFVLKQQNPYLNEGDIEHMMSRVLGKENSVVDPGSSTFTHVPYLDQVYRHIICIQCYRLGILYLSYFIYKLDTI